MRKTAAISPRKDFSPIRLRVENTGRRPRTVVLFRVGEEQCQLLHPDMHYGVLCSMLERVQLRMTKTYVQLIKGNPAQLEQPLTLQVLERADQDIAFHAPPRFSEDNMRTNEIAFRLGPQRRLLLKVLPQTTVELCFFVANGIVPSGVGRPIAADAEE